MDWIRTSIDAKVCSTVTHVHDAYKLWETLKFRFSIKNGARIHQLHDAITNYKQDGQSVLDYYGRLTKLWEELQNLKTTRLVPVLQRLRSKKKKRTPGSINFALVLMIHAFFLSGLGLLMKNHYQTLILYILE